MLDQLKTLFVDSPLFMAVFDSMLQCTQISSGWAQFAGIRNEDIRKLGIAELFEIGSQLTVEHKATIVLKKSQSYSDLPVNIFGDTSSRHGTLAIWPAVFGPDQPPSVIVVFIPHSQSSSVTDGIIEKMEEISKHVDAVVEHGNEELPGGRSLTFSSTTNAQLVANIEQLRRHRDLLVGEVNRKFGPMVGQSNSFNRVMEQIKNVATSSANAMVSGEIGVGKEMIARAIHGASPQSESPFVKVNCVAIKPDRIDAELFGSDRRTQSIVDGKFYLASGGTLFLEGVDAIPLATQSKIMRAMDSYASTDQKDTIDSSNLRVIASTCRDLQLDLAEGRFREDLFYRLSVFPIHLPPLRERLDDIFPLTKHFLKTFCQELGRTTVTITNHQCQQLQAHSWPGNVLELKILLERAIILSSNHLLRLDLALHSEALDLSNDIESGPREFVTDVEFQKMERKNIISALEHAGWRISGAGGAAELLGIKPSTMSYRMKRLDIKRD